MFTQASKADYSFDYFHPTTQPPTISHKKAQFNPYINNEGTVIAIAGADFVIVAADTRLSNNFLIVSRNSTKIFQLTEDAVLASSGMYADIMALKKYLEIEIEMYKSTCKRTPSLQALSQLLSKTLYQRRFFPYYAFNALCGKTDDGKFVCYGYDAVGSFHHVSYGSQGSGSQMVYPVLDTFFKLNPQPTLEQAKKIILETMNGTSNRDIYTGDKVQIFIMRRDLEPVIEEYPLRKD